MGKLSETAENVEKRIKKKDDEIKNFKTEALAKKKAKDDRGRLVADLFLTENRRYKCHEKNENGAEGDCLAWGLADDAWGANHHDTE